MSINGTTDLERAMFDKGYASARLIARKTRLHRSTIARLIRMKTLEGMKVAGTAFATVDSVMTYMGPGGAELFDMEDWTDVMTESAVEVEVENA